MLKKGYSTLRELDEDQRTDNIAIRCEGDDDGRT